MSPWAALILALLCHSPHHHAHCPVVSRTVGAALGSTVTETTRQCADGRVIITDVIRPTPGAGE